MARPTKYIPIFSKQVYKLKLEGKNDVEVADFFGVSHATIDNWKHEHEEFLGHYKKGVAGKICLEVSAARRGLAKRAEGFTFKEVKTEQNEGDESPPKITTTTKYSPPDVMACTIILNNLDSDTFKPRKAVEDDTPIVQQDIDEKFL